MSGQYEWDSRGSLPGGLYDVAANETWLEEQAKAGFHVQRFLGSTVLFELGESADVRYRFQPMRHRNERVGKDRLALYGDLGWEYVDSVSDTFQLWRCGDSSAPELDTDPLVQADGYRYLKKRMMRTAALQGMIAAALLVLCIAVNFRGSTLLRNLLRDQLPFQMMLLLGSVAYVAFWEISSIRTMLALLKRLEAGEKMERPKFYRKKLRLQRIGTGMLVAYWILHSLVLFWPAGNRDMLGWSAMANDRTPEKGIVYLDLEHLAEQGQEMRFECVLRKFHELAPAVTQVRQRAAEGGIGVTADTTHYVLLCGGLSDRLVEDIRYAYRNWEPFEEIEAAGLDRFLISVDDGPQVVIAVKGREVLEIVYGGETDLRLEGTYIASLLS